MSGNVYIYIIVMALVTYLIRMLPIVLFRKEIKNKFVKSFLYYVPYACLASMTFPAILFATQTTDAFSYGALISALVGFAVALFVAYKEKSLIVVAAFACGAALITERATVYIPLLIERLG